MPTEKQIKASYRKQHDELSKKFYEKQEISKAEFDSQHGQLWANMEAELIAEGHIQPTVEPRDLASEVDALKARVEALEGVG